MYTKSGMQKPDQNSSTFLLFVSTFAFCAKRHKLFCSFLTFSHLVELVIDTKVNFALASLLMSMGMDICGLSKIQ